VFTAFGPLATGRWPEKGRWVEERGSTFGIRVHCGPTLILVLPALVGVAHGADAVGLEEDHLGDAFVGVDLGGQRGGVADLDGHLAAPLGLEGGDVDDDAAAGVGALAHADRQHVAGDGKVSTVSHRAKLLGGMMTWSLPVAVVSTVTKEVVVEVLGIDDGLAAAVAGTLVKILKSVPTRTS
jgi:hypothetical protein